MNSNKQAKKQNYVIQIKDFLFSNYNLLNTWKHRLVTVFTLFIISYTILLIFKPFGLLRMPSSLRYLLILKYTAYPLLVWYSITYLFELILKKPYTILRTFNLLFLLTFIAGITSYLIWSKHFGQQGLNWLVLKNFQVMALSTGFIPMVLVIVFHYNYVLQKRLRELLILNESIHETKETIEDKKVLNILSKEQKKKYQFSMEDIVFVQAEDNYVKVVSNIEGIYKHSVIRTTLSNTEQEIIKVSKNIFRCHNSYIANMHQVIKIEGNSSGYKLFMNDKTEPIPVSRKFVPKVKAYFNS